MGRVAGKFGRFALVMFVLAGAAWGQGLNGISFGVVEARKFDSIRLLPDVKAGVGRGNTLGLVSSGQRGTQDAPGSSVGKTAPAKKIAKPAVHRFWDTENILLFAGVGAARGLDYASTLNIRRRGIDEAFLTNAIVDNHPEFAAIEAAATAASIGISYIFHATGHHRLERWTSYVHIGVAVGGAIRNYALKTAHPGV
jgi:hypothetical protein